MPCTPSIWWYIIMFSNNMKLMLSLKFPNKVMLLLLEQFLHSRTVCCTERGQTCLSKETFQKEESHRKWTYKNQLKVCWQVNFCNPEHLFKRANKKGNIRILYYLRNLGLIKLLCQQMLVQQALDSFFCMKILSRGGNSKELKVEKD